MTRLSDDELRWTHVDARKGESSQDRWRKLSYATLYSMNIAMRARAWHASFTSTELLGNGLMGSSKATGFHLAAESCCWEDARRIGLMEQNNHIATP